MTLRTGVLIVAGLCFAAALIGALSGVQPAWIAALECAVAIALIVFERARYRPHVDPTHGAWEPTGERFIDPASGKPVQVYYNAATGQRDYRPLER